MTRSLFAQAALSLSLSFLLPFSYARPEPRATVCNGSSDFCSRSYGNITFVGAHDSYAVGSTNPAANQDYDVTQQLNDGIRMLQNQAHSDDSTIHLCHTACILLDGGTLQAYLTKVQSWLNSNPNDVVSILLVNYDNLNVSEFGSIYQTVGLDKMSYVPPTAALTPSQWPTLGQMIDNGTRLVTFMDNGADYNTVPYIIDEFSSVWETAYDLTSPDFDCNTNRSHGVPANQMYLINHFLDQSTTILGESILTPKKSVLNVTNAVSGAGSLGDQASECVSQWGRAPNFMLVDFYEHGGGSVFDVAASLNDVAYTPATPIASVPSATSTSSTSETSTPLSGAMGLRIGTGLATASAVVVGILLGAWIV